MKVIFMGTSQFACPALQKLISNKILDSFFEIIAVYTRAPQIAGRGHKIQNSPIHNLALENNLKIFTPKSLNDDEVKKEFLNLSADIAVVVSYGLLLPKEILCGTKYGCVNIHPSLLPRWRGAAPIQRTIMAGDQESAVNIIQMDEGLDSGDVIAEEKFKLNGDETYESLSKKTSLMGADLLVKTLKEISQNKVSARKQNQDLVTYAKKISKDECQIDWQQTAQEIEQKIRALSGSLGAFLNYGQEKIKILAAEIIQEAGHEKSKKEENICGKILDQNFAIQCKQGVIRPTILQRQGKKLLMRDEFLRGFKLEVGKIC